MCKTSNYTEPESNKKIVFGFGENFTEHQTRVFYEGKNLYFWRGFQKISAEWL